MSQKFKPLDQDDEDNFDLGIKIPKLSNFVEDLESAYLEALKSEHKQETEEDEKKGNAKKQKRGGAICCCQDSNCRIGPFTERV